MARAKQPKRLTPDEMKQLEEDLKNAPDEDVTTFEEDDDPRQLVGEVAEDDEEGQDR